MWEIVPLSPSRRPVLMRFLCLFVILAACAPPQPGPTPAGDLVSIADLDPTIVVEARYYGSHNFIGRPITGYEAPKCILSRPAAEALVRVQAELRPMGLGLKTYDCYRPQRAVDDFVAWAQDLDDTAMKTEFYPEVAKSSLFSDGYIASRSGHSRASTVDLTIIPLPVPPQPPVGALVDCRGPVGERFADNSVDMGTGYDCFDPLSHTDNPAIRGEAMANRQLLKRVMERHGFTNYPQEWWHFTLAGEPYPDTYFDVPVR